jgi:fatty acid omega-hydroxylase
MVGLGVDPGCLAPDLPSNPFASAFEDALECTTVRFFLPPSWWRALRLLGLGLERRMPESLSIIDRFIEHAILARRRELEEQADGPPDRPIAKSDLLSCFLHAGVDFSQQNPRFLKDISINFLLAGRDTSALALSWFFWLVATHPRVEAKIVDEVRRVVLGSATAAQASSLARSELNQLTYLHAALSEALRLYPSVPSDLKHVLADDVLPDGNRVRKGQKLAYQIYTMGRMESIWGPDCESFRPERWLSDEDSETPSLRCVSPFLFTAFNAGPRTCLGKEIAYLLMKAVASAVLYNYRIVLVPGYRVVPKLSATLYMKNGLLVTLEPRRWP